jgi:hypothetical protein
MIIERNFDDRDPNNPFTVAAWWKGGAVYRTQ